MPPSHASPQAGDAPPRSGYGLVPGAELPGAVYLVTLLAYTWMLGAAWLAFGSSVEAHLYLAIATVLAIVIFALPILIIKTAARRSDPRCAGCDMVDTATGNVTMSQACVQILLLPCVLALAATAFGLTYLLVG